MLLAVFACFAVLQAVWLGIDRRAPVEERDFLVAARLAHVLRGDAVGRAFPDGAAFVRHSPLVPTWAGLWMSVLGCRGDVAVLSLLPFAALLLWASYRVARRFLSEAGAVACAALTLGFHHFAVVEPFYPAYVFLSEFKLDLPLSAFVAATAWRLPALFEEPSRRNRAWLAAALAAGMLTRVVFPLYVVIVIAGLWGAGCRRTAGWLAALRALPPALLLSAPWYLLQLRPILRYMTARELSAEWALVTGLPDIGTWQNLGYYGVCAVDMLSPPFLVLAAAGALALVMRRAPARGFVLSALGLAFVLLTLHWGKSIRFLAPVLLPLALAVAACADLPRRAGARRALAALLIAGACLRMLLLHGFVPGYRDTSGVDPLVLTPSRSDWRVPEILDDVVSSHDTPTRLRVAVVPFLGPFRHASFMLAAGERGIVLDPDSDWRLRTDTWRDELARSPFIVAREPESPPNVYAPHLRDAARWLAAQTAAGTVRETGRYALPDGSTAVLYRQAPPDPGWVRLDRPSTTNVVADFDGTIRLRSVSVESGADELAVRCEWECVRRPEREYRLFIQQRRGWTAVEASTFVPGQGLRPVTTWMPGLCFVETYRLPRAATPDGAPCVIWLGWFRGSRRLPVRVATRPVLLRAVRVDGVRPHALGPHSQ